MRQKSSNLYRKPFNEQCIVRCCTEVVILIMGILYFRSTIQVKYLFISMKRAKIKVLKIYVLLEHSLSIHVGLVFNIVYLRVSPKFFMNWMKIYQWIKNSKLIRKYIWSIDNAWKIILIRYFMRQMDVCWINYLLTMNQPR